MNDLLYSAAFVMVLFPGFMLRFSFVPSTDVLLPQQYNEGTS
jgi:hypothetical protein